jgi:hypothetical protein
VTATNQNFIHEKVKSRLNSGNTCYQSVQNFFFSSLLLLISILHQISLGQASQGGLDGRVAFTGVIRNAYNILVRKPGWEDSSKMDLKTIMCEGMEWIHLAQDRVQWQALIITIMNFWVPSKAGNFLTS